MCMRTAFQTPSSNSCKRSTTKRLKKVSSLSSERKAFWGSISDKLRVELEDLHVWG